MLRKLTKYIMALAMPLLVGCSAEEFAPDIDTGAGKVTITLRNGEGKTRANDDDNNEALLSNAVVALYPDAPGENDQAVALEVFSGLDAQKSTKVTMTLSEEMVTKLFNSASGTSCKMYVVANIDNPGDVSPTATIAELKAIEAGLKFDSQKIQNSFVMAGQGTVTYSNAGTNIAEGSASGAATLYRAAAKIRLNISLPEKVEQDGETWVPVTLESGIRVLLNNGVKNAVAAPGADFTPAEADYYSITTGQSKVVRVMTTENGSAEYPYHNVVPFYTYPNHWEATPDEQHRTSMTLIVPWQKQGAAEYQTFYYEVPVTDQQQLVSNYYYIVNLKVNMLGSLIPDTPEEVTDLSYQIVDWGKEDIDVNITDYRYLVVNPTMYEADNEAEITIPFYTSHATEVTNIKMTYNRYNYYDDGNGDVVSFDVPRAVIDASNTRLGATGVFCSYEVTKDAVSGQTVVKINHPLKVATPYTSANRQVSLTGRSKTSTSDRPATVQNSIAYYTPTTENAYSAYTIEVTIAHTDNENFSETITITQYPGMYIEAVRNPGGGTSNKGNVFVNDSQSTTTLGGVHGLTGGNKNPNMYLINISTLDESSGYFIGDPRTQYYTTTLTGSGNLSIPTANDTVQGWSASAKALYNAPGTTGNRRLTYYYPTIESQDNQYKMMVAPKFRVASSYGVTNQVSRENARKRIASYQETGCPAGRWRLPTYGELQFIITLSSSGKIPVLFTKGSTYWTAQGPCQVSSNGAYITLTTPNNNTRAAVRGVYDEWYWEEKTDYTITPNANGNYTFTWGDVPRDVVK